MLHTPARQRWAAMAIATALGTGVLASQSAALGAVETCQDLPATVVGSPGAQLVGTEGADVIVSNGAAVVASLGGDDVICLTAASGARDLVSVSAGVGNDQVVNLRSGSMTQARVDLGAGDDTYTGSNGKDLVREIGDESGDEGAGTDRIRTGAGNDSVTSGAFGQPNADTVDLGPGRDELELRSTDNLAATFLGGGGSDELSRTFTFPRQAGVWRFDNTQVAARPDSVPMITWSGFERFDLEGFGNGQHMSFVGGSADEDVSFAEWWIDVALVGGDDRIVSGHNHAG